MLERFPSSFSGTIKSLPEGTRWQGMDKAVTKQQRSLSCGGDTSSGVWESPLAPPQTLHWEAAGGWTRQGFITQPEMRVYPLTASYHLCCSELLVFFTDRKNNFPLKDLFLFFFLVKYFQSFNYYFFLAIACVLSSRETQRSQSLLHLSPGSPSHVLKAWLQWGIAFPLCKFNVPFFLHLQM